MKKQTFYCVMTEFYKDGTFKGGQGLRPCEPMTPGPYGSGY